MEEQDLRTFMQISDLRLDKRFIANQLRQKLGNQGDDAFVEEAAGVLISGAHASYRQLRANPIREEYLYCPDLFYGIYQDMWDLIGELNPGAKVLEIGIGTGGHLMFYTPEQARKTVGLDKHVTALCVLKDICPHSIEEVLPIEMEMLGSEGVICSPLAACIGANTLYYAEGEHGLEIALNGIDKKLTSSNTRGEKHIVHLFYRQPEDPTIWGGLESSVALESEEKLFESYDRFFQNFKTATEAILQRLGYRVTFTHKSRYAITTSDQVTKVQRQLLGKDRNVYEVYKGLFAKSQVDEFNGETIKPGEFLQLVTFDMMHALSCPSRVAS